MVSLNSTVSCGTMPMARAQALLRHLGDVLAVDEDAAGGHIVEAIEQPRDRRLAGARRADDGHRVPGRHA